MSAVGSNPVSMGAPRTHWEARLWNGMVAGVMAFFLINVGLIVASVATSSFARRWFNSWLPDGYTTSWYLDAWKEFQLASVLLVTVQIVLRAGAARFRG
jgi:putative spermidine/putrescine transport system permease protein